MGSSRQRVRVFIGGIAFQIRGICVSIALTGDRDEYGATVARTRRSNPHSVRIFSCKMHRPSRFALRHWVTAALVSAAGCGSHAKTDALRDPPPRAEFLVIGNDSTYWVSTMDGRPSVRGEPLVLARYGGRWFEVYSADDDRSFNDALLVGQFLYKRDLVTGDSSLVFADTVVPRMAEAYARGHPDEKPLTPDEDGQSDPSQQATAELDIVDVYGPFLSYEYRLDVSSRGMNPWHTTRRGVVDLRSGKSAAVGDLFAAAEATRVIAAGRRVYAMMRDSVASVASSLGPDERRAAAAIAREGFDERSFSITSVGGRPAIAFHITGRGEGPEGNGLELEPVPVDSTNWFPDPVSARATTDSTGSDHWDGDRYRVIARYDTSGGLAQLSVADSAKREWPLASIGAPVHRVDWLDRPPVSVDDRRALLRAFNAASMYGEPPHVAMLAGGNLQFARHDTVQSRTRKPARILRAHVAATREQHGPRVRRRGSFDDGQDGGDRRVQTQPSGGRHGVDRPRRLSRTNSPRRPVGDESERQLGWANVDGSGRPR